MFNSNFINDYRYGKEKISIYQGTGSNKGANIKGYIFISVLQ